jgi:hypothetical protein
VLLKADEKISRETVEAAIEGKAISTVLVTRLLGVEQGGTYVQSATPAHYGSYYRYYSQSWHEAYSGRYRGFEVLTLETNIYDVNTGKRVWSIQSESIEPGVVDKVIAREIELVINTLSERGLL